MGYEWFKLSTQARCRLRCPSAPSAPPSTRCRPSSTIWSGELDKVEFLRPAEKRDTMLVNLRNIFTRMDPTKQDMHTLHGVVMAIAEGRKGPAKGGVLDGAQATRLRALLAEQGQGGATADSSSTVRGLARLLRRNPTDAERILWQALTKDRRFAGQFKRQTPGRPPYPGLRLLRRTGSRSNWKIPTRAMRSWPTAPARKGWLEARGLPRDQHARRRRRAGPRR